MIAFFCGFMLGGFFGFMTLAIFVGVRENSR